MPKRILILALVIAGCAKSGRGDGEGVAADSSQPAPARAITAVAFRVPRTGGTLSVYALPALDSTPWGGGSRLSGARSAVGVDHPGRRLLFLDSTDAVASFDLVSLRQKTIAPRRATATIAADGSLLAVDSSGGVTESQPWGSRAWSGSLGRGVTRVFAAPGPRLLVVRRTSAGDSLLVVSRETGVSQSVNVPAASDVVASRDGDAVAFAIDSGLVVYEDRELNRPWFVRLGGTPRAVAFSPSGHRIYVALRDKGELAVVDRFNRRERSAISLPGPATALRADPWGRALLVRGGGDRGDGDIWVVGVARNEVIGRLTGGWASDLPTAAQTGVILTREGASVVARDIHSMDSLAAVRGAADDLWFAGRWVPTSGVAAMRAHAADGRRPTADSQAASRQPSAVSREPSAVSRQPLADQKPTQPPQPDQPAFWIQLTSTRSEEAARALVNELRSPFAQVVAPKTEDDTWRVMVGPFWTREAADSAGRSIGRPYWVLDRSRERTPAVTVTQLLAGDLEQTIPSLLSGASVIALVPATELRGWAAEMAWSVARAAAAGGRRTVLVDCFVAAPTLHAVAGDGNNEGLVDAFEYGASLNRIVQQQPQADLFFIPAGTYSADAEPLMQHPRWKRLSAGFRHEEALLLLYVGAEHLSALAAEPDGVIALAPQGQGLAAADAPALAAAVGRGLPLIAVVAEHSSPEARGHEGTGAREDAQDAPADPEPRPVFRERGPAPMAMLLQEQSGPRWRGPAIAMAALVALAAALGWWFMMGRPAASSPAPATVDSAPAALPLSHPPTLPPSESLPFAVQVASLPRLADAFALADTLAAHRAAAIVAPIRLPGRAALYRVLAGPYATRALADSALVALRGALPAAGGGTVVDVPLSLPLSAGLSRDAASAERARLRAAGVPAFILGQADGAFRLFAGAYGAAVTPAMLPDLLTPTGSAGDLVPRAGYVP